MGYIGYRIGVYGDLIAIYAKRYSIYLSGTMSPGLVV